MSSAAANAALGIEVLAVQRLWYAENPNAGTSIFMLFSSQCLLVYPRAFALWRDSQRQNTDDRYRGYGIAGLMRSTLVYPSMTSLGYYS